MEGLSFRPLTEQDLPMLHAWVQRPHVAAWWDAPCTLQDIKGDYLPTLQGHSSTRAYIAALHGEPVGFIQAYVQGSGDGWWEDETDPGARGIDQFLADARRCNQGLGTAMITAFIEQLLQDPSVTKVQTDPSPGNHRAIRCYGKVGFEVVGEVVTPDGPALLMRYERARHRLPGGPRREGAMLCLVWLMALLCVSSGGALAQASSTAPSASMSSDGAPPPRRFSEAEKLVLMKELGSPTPTFGALSAEALAAVDRFAEYSARHPNPLSRCASKYAFVRQGKALPPFAASAEGSVINMGGIELQTDPIHSGGGLIDKGGKNLQQPEAGKEVVIQLQTNLLFSSGITKTARLLVTRESERSCSPRRSGCRLYEGQVRVSRYDILGTVYPEPRWVGEQDLGSVQVEVVCAASRRTGDPFFTVPWYEYVVAVVMRLFGSGH
jgi:RimJ/RimL family protein N-acetyltransferase